MSVRWLRSALGDLQAIRQYIARDSQAAALRVVREIRRSAELLAEQPELGRAGRIAGTREWVVRRYPYIVAYRCVAHDVQILAVIHTSRCWPDELP